MAQAAVGKEAAGSSSSEPGRRKPGWRQPVRRSWVGSDGTTTQEGFITMRAKLTVACALTAFVAVAGGTAEAAGLIHTNGIAKGAITFNRLSPGVQRMVSTKALPGPAGANGLPGLNGAAGAAGAAGAQGGKGDAVVNGLQGPKGDTGAAGPQGVKGDAGPKGDPGVAGMQGSKGDTGAAGLQGAKGDTGATGAVGAQGPAGAKGDPAPSNAPSPAQFRNFTVTAGPDSAPCVLARAASQDTFVITFEGTSDSGRGLALYTSTTCSSDQQITPNVRVVGNNTASNAASQATFTPGFTVPAGTALYSMGSGFVNGYVIDPSPSQFRNFTVTAGPDSAPCVLARAASGDTFVITYEATNDAGRGLALYTSPSCTSNQLTPSILWSADNNETNVVSQETFTPGFAVPAGTALYSLGSGFVNGYVTN